MCQIHKETDFLIQNHFFHCRYQEKKKENCICHLCKHSLSGNAYSLYGLVISNKQTCPLVTEVITATIAYSPTFLVTCR